MSTHLLIRWAEEPPKWDVVRRKQITKVFGAHVDAAVDDLKKFIGMTVLAVYDKKKNPSKAKVLDAGSRNEMDKAYRLQVEEYGTSDAETEFDQPEDRPASASQHQKALKRVENQRAKQVLEQLLPQQGCANCTSFEEKIAALEKENEDLRKELHDSKRLSASMDRLQKKLDEAVCTMEECSSTIRSSKRAMSPTRTSSGDSEMESHPRPPPKVPRPYESRELDTEFWTDGAATPKSQACAAIEPSRGSLGTAGDQTVLLGSMTINKAELKSLNWGAVPKDQPLVVRSLLKKLLGNEVLAAHSLTGLPSNAHPNKPAKPALDAQLVQDVVATCHNKMKMKMKERDILSAISKSCIDAATVVKRREEKAGRMASK